MIFKAARLIVTAILFIQCATPIVIIIREDRVPIEKMGFLKIKSSPPFASFIINGVLQGVAPTYGFIAVPAGPCHLEFFHSQGIPVDTTVFVKLGEATELKVNLMREEKL